MIHFNRFLGLAIIAAVTLLALHLLGVRVSDVVRSVVDRLTVLEDVPRPEEGPRRSPDDFE